MNTRLLVRPNVAPRIVDTVCEDSLVLLTEEISPLIEVGSWLTISLEGAENVMCEVTGFTASGLGLVTNLDCAGVPEWGPCLGGISLDIVGVSSFSADIQTTTGYATFVVGLTATTVGNGNPGDVISGIQGGPGSHICFYGSDASGNNTGSIITYLEASGESTALNFQYLPDLTFLDVVCGALLTQPNFCYCPNLTHLGLQGWPFPTIDISCLPNLVNFGCQISALEVLDFSGNPAMADVYVPNAAILDIDATINSLNAAVPNGSFDSTGGTNAARTSASNTNYNALIANGWTISTN